MLLIISYETAALSVCSPSCSGKHFRHFSAAMLNPDLGNFTYSSLPHAAPTRVATQQPRYRSADDTPLTLMSDPRVVRGSTHSLARKITLSKNELSKSQSIMQRTRTVVHEPPSQPTYSFEVKPFSNNEIDVSTYLVQQTDYRPQKKALDTQTDVFIPRPDTPDYVPAKIGVDTGTQVEDVRDLFDFDTEVTPIVEVIAQKTIDQALFELSSEEELKNLETAARDFRTEKFRNEEWMRNRENQAIKENKQRRERIIQLQTARENEKRTKTIVAGVQMMRQTLPHAFESVCDGLVSSGVWQETDNAIAEKDFIPAVLEQASQNVDAHIAARDALDAILSGTEARYHTFPDYDGAAPPRRMVLVLTFRRAPADGDAPPAEREEGGAGGAGHPADVTVMTVQVGSKDTVDTLNRRIRNEVNRLKQIAARAAERAAGIVPEAEGAEPTADGEGDADAAAAAPAPVEEVPEDAPTVNTVLPDNAALAPLRATLYAALARSLAPELLVSATAPLPGVPPSKALTRDIAYDAALWNFPFPEMVECEMLV